MLKNKIFIVLFLVFGFFSPGLGQEDFIYQAKGKRNPFIPLVGKDGRLMKLDKEYERDLSDLQVDGVIYDKQGVSFALVNGRVAGVGDYAGEYRVLKIQADKITFLKGDQLKEVPINKEGEN